MPPFLAVNLLLKIKMHDYFKCIITMVLLPLPKYLGVFFIPVFIQYSNIRYLNPPQRSVSTIYHASEDTPENNVYWVDKGLLPH